MADVAQHLVGQAYAVRRNGDSLASLELYRRAQIALADDADGRAHCLRHIGDLTRELGRRDEALAALREAEALYRGPVQDTLSLANTVRLIATITGERSQWREARTLYEQAGGETGLDLTPAFAECDRHLSAD